jgi:hypothetical protein
VERVSLCVIPERGIEIMLLSVLALASGLMGDSIYILFGVICILCIILMLVGLFTLLKVNSLAARLDSDEDWFTRKSRISMVKAGMNVLLYRRNSSRPIYHQEIRLTSPKASTEEETICASKGQDPLA